MNKKQLKSLVEKSRRELTHKREELTSMEKMVEILKNQITFEEYTLSEMESMLKAN